MGRRKSLDSDHEIRRIRPALSPEAREEQMIALAVNLAERQLQEGTASSQVITHFLKLGTMRAQLEKERIEHENELLKAKTDSLRSMQHNEELYAKAIASMQMYAGREVDIDD